MQQKGRGKEPKGISRSSLKGRPGKLVAPAWLNPEAAQGGTDGSGPDGTKD